MDKTVMKSEENLVSVIVPVYNVERFLPQCIKSIINQRYRNLEIILIDDGSTDSSGEICDFYETKDKRVRSFHKKNGGLSDARNYGIRKSTGTFLAFVDSDDFVHHSYIEKMMQIMGKALCDIVQCSYERVYEDGRRACCPLYSLITDGEKIQYKLYDKKYMPEPFDVAWNKLYRRQLFYNIAYPVGRLHEDMATTYKILYQANKIAVIPDILYYYRIRKGSITQAENIKNLLDWRQAEKERWNFYKDCKSEKLERLAAKAYYYLTRSCLKSNDISHEQKRRMRIESRNLAKNIVFDSGYTMKEKVGIIWAQLRRR